MISKQVGMRELTTLDGGGVLLHGTYHRVRTAAGGSAPPSTKTLGVMFMNALSSPRSLVGDSGVYWANSFAARGYPSFRFDLPGLGDSYGEIPNDLLRFTNEGGYAAIASSKAKELVQRQQLSGVVLFGHCAGATTAIYAAANCTECKGLVLMDPYFNLPKALTSTLRPGLVLWARRSRVGAVLRVVYDRVREARSLLREGTLPANANLGLIARFKQVAASGVPILMLRAVQPPALSSGNGGPFDYFAHVCSFAVKRGQFTITTIENTDHSFSNRAGRVAVRQHTETWLKENFPEAIAGTPQLPWQDSQIRVPLATATQLISSASPGD